MDKKSLKKVSEVHPLKVVPYKLYSDPENQTVIDKVNGMIQNLHSMGRLTNQVVKQWNEVMDWVVNGGIETITNDTIEVKLDVALNTGLRVLTETVADEKIGELVASGQFEEKIEVAIGNMHENIQGSLNGFAAQLAETSNHLKGRNVNKEAFISFVDDDFTDPTTMDWLLDLFEAEGIPLNVAVITGDMNDVKKINQMKRVVSLGGNVSSHTHTHPRLFDSIGENAIRQELAQSKNFLIQHGVNSNTLVYPGGVIQPLGETLVREYYDLGITVGGGVNSFDNSFSNYRLKRVEGPGEQASTLESCKAAVLEAKEKGGWLIFMTHAKASVSWDLAVKQQMIDLVKFIKAEGVKVTSLTEAFNKKKNPLDVANKKGDFFRVSQSGLVNWSEIKGKIIVNETREVDNATPIKQYPEKSLSIHTFYSSDTRGFPEKAGTLRTYRVAGDIFSLQEFHSVTGYIYTRRVSPTGEWTEWDSLGKTRQHTTGNIDFGTIPAKGLATVEVPFPGANVGSTYSLTPVNGMSAGIMLYCFSSKANTVNIRAFNGFDTALAFSRYFYIKESY